MECTFDNVAANENIRIEKQINNQRKRISFGDQTRARTLTHSCAHCPYLRIERETHRKQAKKEM